MNQQDFDQFFRDKLSGMQHAMPSHEDWIMAKSMLAAEKSNKDKFIWWLLLLGCFNALFTYSISPTGPSDSKGYLNPTRAPAMVLMDESNPAKTIEDVSPTLVTPSKRAVDESDAGMVNETDALAKALDPEDENKSTDLTKSAPADGAARPLRLSSQAHATKKVEILTINPGSNLRIAAEESMTAPMSNQHSIQPSILPTYDFYLADNQTKISVKPSRLKTIVDRKVHRPQKYAWTATLLLNPASNLGEPVHGLQLGFMTERFLSRNLFLGFRPSLQVTLNEHGFSKFQVQTSYSFSAISETYGLRATSLQFIRLPLYVGLEFHKHSLEMGAGANLLLSARGQLQQVEFEDNDLALVNSFSSGWIDTGQMQRFSYNVFFGYKYAISPVLKTGITIFHNPENIYPTFGDHQFQNLRKWFMGIQFNYYIK